MRVSDSGASIRHELASIMKSGDRLRRMRRKLRTTGLAVGVAYAGESHSRDNASITVRMLLWLCVTNGVAEVAGNNT